MTRLTPTEFVALARRILGDCNVYADNTVEIRSDHNGLDLQITRLPMPEVEPHLTGRNPVTMVRNGEIIRNHGEHAYLVEHMLEIANS